MTTFREGLVISGLRERVWATLTDPTTDPAVQQAAVAGARAILAEPAALKDVVALAEVNEARRTCSEQSSAHPMCKQMSGAYYCLKNDKVDDRQALVLANAYLGGVETSGCFVSSAKQMTLWELRSRRAVCGSEDEIRKLDGWLHVVTGEVAFGDVEGSHYFSFDVAAARTDPPAQQSVVLSVPPKSTFILSMAMAPWKSWTHQFRFGAVALVFLYGGLPSQCYSASTAAGGA